MQRKRFLKGTAWIISILVLANCLPPVAAVSTSASAAALMDVDSGRVLYAYRENEKMGIASTTKIMTALLAIENGNLSDIITVQKADTNVEGTSMYLKPGEQLSLETLLYGLLLCSGNDAALVIAHHIGGSQEKFVAMMNAKAQELGMKNTSFANPNGLDNDHHYSTALDMAKLAREAVENPTMVRMTSTKSITIGGRTMNNHNKLLKYLDGCIGLKTGYTKSSGRTLVSCAVRNGQKLVAVTLQDGNDWADHEQLYDYGFSTYPAKTAVTMGETVAQIPVKGGGDDPVSLIASDTFAWPTSASEKLTVKLDIPKVASGMITAGQKAGQAIILLDGAEVGEVNLLYGGPQIADFPEPIHFFHQLQEMLASK